MLVSFLYIFLLGVSYTGIDGILHSGLEASLYIFCTQWWCGGANVEVSHRQHTLHYSVTCQAAYTLLHGRVQYTL